jgi:hypothetical protein
MSNFSEYFFTWLKLRHINIRFYYIYFILLWQEEDHKKNHPKEVQTKKHRRTHKYKIKWKLNNLKIMNRNKNVEYVYKNLANKSQH